LYGEWVFHHDFDAKMVLPELPQVSPSLWDMKCLLISLSLFYFIYFIFYFFSSIIIFL
jgi:hypothetical protein